MPAHVAAPATTGWTLIGAPTPSSPIYAYQLFTRRNYLNLSAKYRGRGRAYSRALTTPNQNQGQAESPWPVHGGNVATCAGQATCRCKLKSNNNPGQEVREPDRGLRNERIAQEDKSPHKEIQDDHSLRVKGKPRPGDWDLTGATRWESGGRLVFTLRQQIQTAESDGVN
jgi:hypothetical protein